MMHRRTVEILVGVFMLAGFAALVMLALKVSGLQDIDRPDGYTVMARFDNIGGLRNRARVTIGGVQIGRVTNIRLDPANYQAVITLSINPGIETIPSDSSASIRTSGLIGDKYIAVTAGADETFLHQGDEIQETHSAIVLEDLIEKLLFSKDD